VRECAFCPGEANTGEHVWSAWIGDLFADYGGFNFTRFNLQTRKTSQWRRTKISEKTKVVCSQCNNGWMSELEGRAKVAFSSMIRDRSEVCLLSRGIALLAAFAFKCAVVSDYSSSPQDPFFPRFDRHRFRESLTIPSGVRMWIAAFSSSTGSRGVDNHYRAGPTRPGFVGDLKFYTHTFVAGCLALQIHAVRWATPLGYAKPLPGSIQPEIPLGEELAVQFWPDETGFAVDWPPPANIRSDTLQRFIYRWSGGLLIAR
jgi:hypothetical protein